MIYVLDIINYKGNDFPNINWLLYFLLIVYIIIFEYFWTGYYTCITIRVSI